MVDKKDVWIFDLDGTLACNDHRGPFEEHKVCNDTPIEPVIRILKALMRAGERIVFVSGRTSACEYDTRKWIGEHTNMDVVRIELYMRNAGDRRKDSIVKKEIYDKFIFPLYNVIGVFDDRLQVCRMLYENNIFCFNVNQGLKEF